MSKYQELDEMIVWRIAQKPCSFTELQDEPISGAANALATPDRYEQRVGWRVIDRRLQALRKAGRIVFAKGVWSEVKP